MPHLRAEHGVLLLCFTDEEHPFLAVERGRVRCGDPACVNPDGAAQRAERGLAGLTAEQSNAGVEGQQLPPESFDRQALDLSLPVDHCILARTAPCAWDRWARQHRPFCPAPSATRQQREGRITFCGYPCAAFGRCAPTPQRLE